MKRKIRSIPVLALLVASFTCWSAWAQLPALTQSSSPSTTTTDATDSPYGRTTPRGTVIGFLDAAQANNWSKALRYLEIPPRLNARDLSKLPHELRDVLDSQVINLYRISNDPQGKLDDSLPPDVEKLITVQTGKIPTDILLHRVKNTDGSMIWLFSEETLSQVPRLAEEVDRPAIEEYLPSFALKQTHFLSLRIWQLVSLLIVIPLAFPVANLITRLLVAALRPVIQGIAKERAGRQIESLGAPLRVIVLVFVMHAAAYSILSLPVLARQVLLNVVSIVTICLFAWLLIRVIDVCAQLTLTRWARTRDMSGAAVVQLVRRLLRACVVGLAVLLILRRMGVNLTAVLAGVSVVGIAIALAAQKTLENLFGGIMLITDEPIRVGDYAKFGSQGGTVEDIGLRSTRFRTPQRTVIAVPNGQLSGMNIENLTQRDKILFNPTVGLRCETSADQTRYVLAELRRMLYGHPRVETASARVRFINLGASTLDLEIFAYVLTRDSNEFLAIQEDLLLRIMDIVEAAGSGMAFPSQTLYLGKDTGLDPAKTQAAIAQVQKWRKDGALPFPDFHPEEIEAMEDKLLYPPDESSQRQI